MAVPVLATKLHIPPPPSKTVVRTRLIERMNESLAAGRRLTLLSAPAGFGKSTLAGEWIADCKRPAAWLSLDENDNDPGRFLIYLISALQTVSPGLGAGALEALQGSQPPPLELILTALLNEISAAPEPLVLVLDDYHLVDHQPVDEALTFLVEHLPPRMHLVMTTREDPSLPLPRMRARNQLVELRAADLRFTPSEAAEFLNRVMSLDLPAEAIAALEARTEGWIAGLQLAALSMQGQEDVHGFIQAFAGDHRHIVDYLVEEVLQRQPGELRNFLLQTSILERLNGPLCEAVTAQPGGRARLEDLQRGNLFLIPLDDRRDWYRYHHLFADVLRMHLMAEQAGQISTLHRRASRWYEQNGLTPEAVRHALAGADFEGAARLIERVLPSMRQSRQEPTFLVWLKALPDEVFQNHPVLHVNYAGTLLLNGQFEGVESRLRDVEAWLAAPEDVRPPPVYVDMEEFQRLPSLVSMYRAAMALAQGDVANAMKHARKVLEHAREDDDFPRGAGSSLLGLASWTNGDLETAYQMFSTGMAHLQKVGFISDVIGGAVTLAEIRVTQGRLHEAMSIYEGGLLLAKGQGGPPLRGAADMHVGMSGLYHEWDDLEAAEQQLLKSRELGELNGLPKNPYRWRTALARIRESQGALEEALDLLHEAEPLYQGDFSPNVRPITALKARIWIKQGELEKARAWRRAQKLSTDEETRYLREFEQITLARLLLAQYQNENAAGPLQDAAFFLERLLKAAEEGGRTHSVIEILVLQALVQEAQEDLPAALPPLERALRLSAPEGYARLFLDEGRAMERLLRQAARQGILPEHVRRLLAGFKSKGQAGRVPSASQGLVEPLSQRELELLRLFKTELSGPEIARELVVALSTVRTHTKSIFSKLNVNNRRAAVKRAIELGLIQA